MFLLTILAFDSPMLFFPGFPDSPLDATYDYIPDHWYCPKRGNNQLLLWHWPRLLPPRGFCALEMSRLIYDNATNTLRSPPGIEFRPHNFGDVRELDALIRGPLGLSFVTGLAPVIKALEKKGYRPSQSLFAITYDWRFGVDQPQSFWHNVKALIESSVAKNANRKAILIGFSLGGPVVHRFLTRETTAEWRSKYIEAIAFVAPALSGASFAPFFAYLGHPLGKIWSWITPKSVTNALRSWPGVYGLLPNAALFNQTVVMQTQNQTVTANGLIDFLSANAGLNDNEKAILRFATNITREIPTDPGVRAYILYNSAIETPLGADLRTGKFITSPGDGEVTAAGSQWACKHWTNVQCVEVNTNKLDHLQMKEDEVPVSLMVDWLVSQGRIPKDL
jgi:hypothetical protein